MFNYTSVSRFSKKNNASTVCCHFLLVGFNRICQKPLHHSVIIAVSIKKRGCNHRNIETYYFDGDKENNRTTTEQLERPCMASSDVDVVHSKKINKK